MLKSYLITGGTGFIGSAVIRSLIKTGVRVRSLDNNSRGTPRNLVEVKGKVEAIEGDIRNYDAVQRAVEGVDGVLHLAAVNGTENFYTSPELVLEVAVKGMVNVIDACKEHKVRHLCVMSSSEVYHKPEHVPTDEGAPLVIPDPFNARYSYSAGKILSEMMAIHSKKHFDRVQIVRPHNVYGPAMGYEHVIPQFVLRMKDLMANGPKRVKFPIQGSGKETRAFLYIDDMVEGFLTILNKGEAIGIYHVGTEEEVTIESLAKQVGLLYGFEVEIVTGPIKEGSTTRRCPDISKLKALGFVPRVSLREGLERTMKWYGTHERLRAA